MSIDTIKKIVVIGAGAMGRQIAMNTVLNGRTAGYEAVLTDSFPEALKKAEDWADTYLAERVAKKRITEEESNLARERLSFSGDVDIAVKDADLVIEAIIEDLEVKKELFGRISRICRPDTILGTNSSNIVSSKLAGVTEHPERLMNIHYFNPALVMKLVELVKGPHTSDETVAAAKCFAENTGKTAIVIKKEVPGFVVNRINAAVANEACSLLEQGVASVEDIDAA